MKKAILIIITFLYSNLLFAVDFRWSKIVTTDDDSTVFYLDKNTVFKVGNFKYYWMLSDYIIPDENGVKSSLTHNMVNCQTLQNKYISFTTYLENMGKGQIDIDIIVPEVIIDMFKWEKFDPETTSQGMILEEVCSIR